MLILSKLGTAEMKESESLDPSGRREQGKETNQKVSPPLKGGGGKERAAMKRLEHETSNLLPGKTCTGCQKSKKKIIATGNIK